MNIKLQETPVMKTKLQETPGMKAKLSSNETKLQQTPVI